MGSCLGSNGVSEALGKDMAVSACCGGGAERKDEEMVKEELSLLPV